MESLAINAKKKVTLDKYFSGVKVVVPNNIKDVVNVSVRSDIISNEIANSFLVLNGKLYVDVVYITEENLVESSTTTLDFIERQKFSHDWRELASVDYVLAKDVSNSLNEITCTVEHLTEVCGVEKYVVGKYLDDDSHLVFNKKTLECTNFVDAGEDRFVVAEEVESNLGEIKVLSNRAEVVVSEVSSSVEKIIIDGKVVVNTLYKDEAGGVAECQKELEFRQEIAVKKAMPVMPTNVVIRVANINVVPDVRDGRGVVSYVVDLFAKVFLFENLIVDSYDDLFSLKNEIIPTYDYLEFVYNDGYKYDTDMVMMQTDISSVQDFDDIIGVYMPKLNDIVCEEDESRVVIKANIEAVAVYKTTSGVEKLNLSYNVKYDTNKELSKKISNVISTISINSFKVKAGKDLEVSFAIGYKMLYEKSTYEKYVKSYEIKQEKQLDDAAVKVYILKEKQSIFDVAKALNVKPEIIAEQNEVDDVFESGQKVYIYSPLNV